MQTMVLALKQAAEENESYRKVVFTGSHSQLVLMSVAAGSEIGLETHPADQFFYIVDGEGTATLGGNHYSIEKGDAIFVPASIEDNIAAGGDEALQLFTVYAPAQHPAGLEQKDRPEPLAAVTR